MKNKAKREILYDDIQQKIYKMEYCLKHGSDFDIVFGTQIWPTTHGINIKHCKDDIRDVIKKEIKALKDEQKRI